MNSLFAIALVLVLHAQTDPERIVCVPNADSSGWECGKGENAPAARPLPRQPRSEAASSPPPYLIDPARLPAVMGTGAHAAAPVAGAEQAGSLDPGPVPLQEPASPQPHTGEPTVEALPSALAPVHAEPVPVAVADHEASAPSPEPVPARPAPAGPVAAESRVPSPESRPTRSISSVARDAAELLALPADAYTVQLVASRSFAGYPELRSRLGVAVEDTFVIRVRRGSEDWWLMLWRDFPDLAAARAAAATLKGSYWPRRLAPLQAEVRATPD